MIVVDDGSTDTTATVVERIDDPRLRRKPNGGLSSAHNAGIRAVRGRYAGLLDGGDIWMPDRAERQIGMLEQEPSVALIYSHSAYLREDDTPDGTYLMSHSLAPDWRLRFASLTAFALVANFAVLVGFDPVETGRSVYAALTEARSGSSLARYMVYELTWRHVLDSPLIGYGCVSGPAARWLPTMPLGSHSSFYGVLYRGGAPTFLHRLPGLGRLRGPAPASAAAGRYSCAGHAAADRRGHLCRDVPAHGAVAAASLHLARQRLPPGHVRHLWTPPAGQGVWARRRYREHGCGHVSGLECGRYGHGPR
ncbi:glycosyltransferase [Dankookia sp. GCM10030260]|uniref:glycosyltransferase n=1 Tax=Dankookia sp. GCM10030260 TaxID=3273390 RepID=UPI00360B8415